ncbi:receptor-like protein kinase 5 [Phragmites australis]|uniref:receptor-like protein kinase 5 n=1 Tax=Phragmites australis TaxID=29695 RepID=UPI002D79F5AC|nr:receptor-like protein kinase 5 [Phragmites australis]
MAKPSFLVLLLIPLLLASNSDSARPNDGELRALLTVKQDWGNPAALSSWKNHSRGNSNSTASASFTYCKWAGVTCNNGQVTALSFQNFHIANPIPASICNLKNLSRIDLSYNNLTGVFPSALYNCSALQFLDLSNNDFIGSLPAHISKLSSDMEHLNLSSNSFVGNVPSAISSFPKLKSLVLDTNSFDGSYPGAAIGNLVELETLTLACNPFAPGSIPGEFSKLKKLKTIWLSGMNLTGVIPEALSVLSELTVLALYQNKLHGDIPAWVWKLQKLQYLYLYANNFIGRIGPDVTAVSMLEVDLSENRLTGTIPETIGNMKKLSLLFLYSNNITGPIPTSIGLLPNLVDIRLFNNSLSGPLPPELGKHSPLGNLEVCNNFLTGKLPETLCFNNKLYDIVVFNNNFSGEFPVNLGECNTLNNIMAYNNNFTGEFPEKVWSKFPNLTNVMIQNNNFTGILPNELSSNISGIEIGNNRFSGAIPASATGLHVFTAENNWFSHGLPMDMTKFTKLTELSLAGNQISGSIPQSIVALERLTYLNLRSNQISGVIPTAIGSLPVLAVLDLSNNELVGRIPEDLKNLHLSYLNLSSNQLAGEVPASLQSVEYYGGFLDNRGLCARRNSGLPLPTCSAGGDHNSRRKIALSVSISSVALVAFVAIGWLIRRRKKDQRDVTSWKMIPFRTLDFTEHDILSNIIEENVIGKGGSGKVYRIHLGSQKTGEGSDEAGHSVVAVKKIGNAGKPDTNLDKEFEAEVRSLGGLRHGNIINLLCCISGEDTKLLIYEYMENGSLDRWLHRRRKRARASGPLDWPTRLSIAIDVARGLSYMHHDFTRPVIHRDVKSSNILLDCGFRAKIADFGLARILAKTGESESASAVCGTFGYIAPEYVYRAKVSEKVDVYSFGVVLLELATGRGPQDGGTESGSCLAKWASKRYKNGGLCVDLVDGEIQDPAYLDDMVAVLQLGLICTSEDPSSRPPMSEVLHQLRQCGRNRMSSDEDAAKDVRGVDSLEYTV